MKAMLTAIPVLGVGFIQLPAETFALVCRIVENSIIYLPGGFRKSNKFIDSFLQHLLIGFYVLGKMRALEQ